MIRRSGVVFAALAVLVVVGCSSQAPKHDAAADKTSLEAVDATWFAAFTRGDSDSVANMYAEDAVVMPPNAPAITGRAAIKSAMGAMMNQVMGARMSMKSSGITGSGVDGDMGWISGAYAVADSTGASMDTGKYLSVHHRVNGQWLFVRDTWNSDMPAAPPAPPAAAKKKK
jgi:uncharacterized protein (TIGR02246 family)